MTRAARKVQGIGNTDATHFKTFAALDSDGIFITKGRSRPPKNPAKSGYTTFFKFLFIEVKRESCSAFFGTLSEATAFVTALNRHLPS